MTLDHFEIAAIIGNGIIGHGIAQIFAAASNPQLEPHASCG